MELIVFAGPSLGRPDPLATTRIDFRPPAACGDIARAVALRPRAIGLIDGLFETTASVWHKELVFALAEGIAVYGAASMGALRALELAPFGMVGVGEVFASYRDGVTEDDDDVAVEHGPAQLGYVPLTVAMVNIRATLAAAMRAEVLGAEAASCIARLAKATFYKDRTWQRILEAAREEGIWYARDEGFMSWLPTHAVDIKRADAMLLVDIMLSQDTQRPLSFPRPILANTTYWQRFRQGLDP